MKIFKKLILLIFIYAILIFLSSVSYGASISKDTEDKILKGEIEISYELFGAVGDGQTDDSEAIREAHTYANNLYRNKGIYKTVYGDGAHTYYIGNLDTTISVFTDVNWNNATFILDDYILDETGTNIVKNQNIFTFSSPPYNNLSGLPLKDSLKVNTNKDNYEEIIEYIKNVSVEDLVVQGVTMSEANLEARKKYLLSSDELYIRVINSNKKQFIRKGINQDAGDEQQDYFLINKKGELLSPIIEDFDGITDIIIYPVEKRTQIVKNGYFISYTNNVVYDNTGEKSRYINRGLSITRSNVELSNIIHTLDESKHESPTDTTIQTNPQGNIYSGFIYINTVTNVTIKDTKLMPHQSTRIYKDGAIQSGSDGTYDLNIARSVNVTLDNVGYSCSCENQTTNAKPNQYCEACYEKYMIDDAYWGIMGGNYIKNLEIYNSKLNRVDAHKGAWNVTIKDTTIGIKGFTLIGGGVLLVENVTIDSPRQMISLRSDYGSTWNGNMHFKDIRYIPREGKYTTRLIQFENEGTWDFGYQCYFPNVIIENVTIDDSKLDPASEITMLSIDRTSMGSLAATRTNPYQFADYIILKEIQTTSGRKVRLNTDTAYIGQDLFKNTEKTLVKVFGIDVKENLETYSTDVSQLTVSNQNELTLKLSQNGSEEIRKTHHTKIEITSDLPEELFTLKYAWTNDNTNVPEENLFVDTVLNGKEIVKTDLTGTFYLWIQIEDSVGNKAYACSNSFIFDNAGPKLEVVYDTLHKENEVKVRIIADEKIKQVEGWTLAEDQRSLEKTYTENTKENMIVEDILGNQTSIMIEVTTIEKLEEDKDKDNPDKDGENDEEDQGKEKEDDEKETQNNRDEDDTLAPYELPKAGAKINFVLGTGILLGIITIGTKARRI